MPYAHIYNLTGFDADTKQKVFQWLNVVAKDCARPVPLDTISHEDQDWIVIGVLYDSTATDWKVDVRKATKRLFKNVSALLVRSKIVDSALPKLSDLFSQNHLF